jgi:hypothetical protein
VNDKAGRAIKPGNLILVVTREQVPAEVLEILDAMMVKEHFPEQEVAYER